MRNQGFEEIYNLQEIITYKDGTGFAEGSTERNTVKRKKNYLSRSQFVLAY